MGTGTQNNYSFGARTCNLCLNSRISEMASIQAIQASIWDILVSKLYGGEEWSYSKTKEVEIASKYFSIFIGSTLANVNLKVSSSLFLIIWLTSTISVEHAYIAYSLVHLVLFFFTNLIMESCVIFRFIGVWTSDSEALYNCIFALCSVITTVSVW